MSSVQIGQKSYEMPPREGISIAHFLTVADIERSARYYEKVFGARILSLGDGNAPGPRRPPQNPPPVAGSKSPTWQRRDG
jgi:hypothetical protein